MFQLNTDRRPGSLASHQPASALSCLNVVNQNEYYHETSSTVPSALFSAPPSVPPLETRLTRLSAEDSQSFSSAAQQPLSPPGSTISDSNYVHYQENMATFPPASHLDNDVHLLRSFKTKLDPLREEFQRAVLDYKFQRQRLHGFALHFQNIKNDLLGHAARLITTGTDSVGNDLNALNNQSQELDYAFHGMKVEGERCAQVENRMADLLFRMERLETKICPALDNHLSNIPQADHIQYWDDHPEYERADETMPDQTPPIVQELYARIGDYKVYFEEMVNFESELRRELDERTASRERGDQLEPDIEFFQERKELRNQMQRDLDQAQAEVHRLRQECRRRGIELDDDAYTTVPHTSDTSPAPFPAHERAPKQANSDPLVPTRSSDIITEFFQSQSRVANWLQNPPREHETVEPPPISPVESEEAIEDCISEGWVAPSPPPRLLPRPTSATISTIQHTPPIMPVLQGPAAGSTEMTSQLHKAMSESMFLTAPGSPSRATARKTSAHF